MAPLSSGLGRVAYVAANGFVSIAALSFLAMLTGVPFVFPSLGPTAYMLFADPLAEAAWPRQTVWGHLIGILCGYLALRLSGLADAPSVMVAGMDGARMLAAAVSLATTGPFMIVLRASHPPACATTMIVSLASCMSHGIWSWSSSPSCSWWRRRS